MVSLFFFFLLLLNADFFFFADHITDEDKLIFNGTIQGVPYLRRAAAIFKIGEIRICNWAISKIASYRDTLNKVKTRRNTEDSFADESMQSDDSTMDIQEGSES